jgi:hypothetical protein
MTFEGWWAKQEDAAVIVFGADKGAAKRLAKEAWDEATKEDVAQGLFVPYEGVGGIVRVKVLFKGVIFDVQRHIDSSHIRTGATYRFKPLTEHIRALAARAASEVTDAMLEKLIEPSGGAAAHTPDGEGDSG